MESAVELAGFFAAHALWCVPEGETLVPILAYQRQDGTQEFRRMECDELRDAVDLGKAWLAKNPEHVASAVLIYDGYVTLAAGKTDALLLEVRSFVPNSAFLTIALPYGHARNPRGFAVHRPKFLSAEGTSYDLRVLGAAFYRGVDRHDKGSKVWNEHLDESK